MAVPLASVVTVIETGEPSTALLAASLIMTTAELVASGELYTCWVNSNTASAESDLKLRTV